MPDDGDAPRLVATLVSLDPQDDGATNVQEWIDAAGPLVYPNDPLDSHTATSAFGQVAFGTPLQNAAFYPILVSGSVAVTAATAGLVNLGVGDTTTPTVDPITPSLTTAALIIIPFSAVVPPGSYLSLTHTGTITPGTPVSIATPLTGAPSS